MPTPNQHSWLPYLFAALTTWRLSHLLMYESGPWNIVLRFREHFGVRHEPDGTPYAWPDGSIFECFLCFSVWMGAVSAALPVWGSAPFALSAVAIFAEKWYKNGTH